MLPVRAILVGLSILGLAASAQPPETAPPQQQPTGKLNVFIFAGQSNMEGRADGAKLSDTDQKRLARVKDRIALAFNGESVRPLGPVAPSQEISEIYKCEQIFGPELFFGIALAEAWPQERFLFIKRTAGATTLHGAWNPDWSPEKAATTKETEAPKLYGELVAYTRTVLAGYPPEDYELRGMLWVQGESDGNIPEAARAYGDNLRALVARIRTDTSQKSLPFLLFEVGGPDVVRGMRRVAQETPDVHLIPQRPEPDSPDFYEKLENGHYNHEGLKKLGLRFAEVYLEANGQAPK